MYSYSALDSYAFTPRLQFLTPRDHVHRFLQCISQLSQHYWNVLGLPAQKLFDTLSFSASSVPTCSCAFSALCSISLLCCLTSSLSVAGGPSFKILGWAPLTDLPSPAPVFDAPSLDWLCCPGFD